MTTTVTVISEIKAASHGPDPPIFRLADLTMLYKQRLEQLGIESPQVHATPLKDQLLCHIPELQAHHQGQNVMLAFEKDVGSILAQASKYSEAIHLAKAAGMIRRDMLNHKSNFSNMFNNADLGQAVHEHGADIKSQLQHGASKSDLAIS